MSTVGIPFLQAQPAASFLGTFVGTTVRIPCEVLKQQLQRGNHKNVQVLYCPQPYGPILSVLDGICLDDQWCSEPSVSLDLGP